MSRRPPLPDLLTTACLVSKRIHGSVHQPTAALVALLLPSVLAELPPHIAEEVVEESVREAIRVGKAAFAGPVDPTAAAILTVATMQPRIEAAMGVRLDNEERAARAEAEAVAREIERRAATPEFAARVAAAEAAEAGAGPVDPAAEVEPANAGDADPLDEHPADADPLDADATPAAEVEAAVEAKPKRPRKTSPAPE